MVRTFIAIDIDKKDLVDKLVSIQKKLMESSASIKFVEPQNLHVTLYFLDEIPEHAIKIISDIIKKCISEQKPFEMRLCTVGAFPSTKRPRVIWVGITKNAETITQIANCLKKQLPLHGFRRETREFHPHVTLARVKRYTSDLKHIIESIKDIDLGSLFVNSIKLKKSILTSRGPIYEDLVVIDLR